MARAYAKYTNSLHPASRASRTFWLALCVSSNASCLHDPSDAAEIPTTSGFAEMDVPPSLDAGVLGADADAARPPSDCAARFCVGSTAQLSEYCDEPHARCPSDIAAARDLACKNVAAQNVTQFQSSCGGAGVRLEYVYGTLDYHYDASGTLTAITTVVNRASPTCDTDVYLYGDSSCRAGALEPITCTP